MVHAAVGHRSLRHHLQETLQNDAALLVDGLLGERLPCLGRLSFLCALYVSCVPLNKHPAEVEQEGLQQRTDNLVQEERVLTGDFLLHQPEDALNIGS